MEDEYNERLPKIRQIPVFTVHNWNPVSNAMLWTRTHRVHSSIHKGCTRVARGENMRRDAETFVGARTDDNGRNKE